jgi:MFS transporter, ACS family, pantothenate transporter
MPIALLGFFFLPDMPANSRAFYLTPEEREFGRRRMELEGRKGKSPFTKAKFKRIFSS